MKSGGTFFLKKKEINWADEVLRKGLEWKGGVAQMKVRIYGGEEEEKEKGFKKKFERIG